MKNIDLIEAVTLLACCKGNSNRPIILGTSTSFLDASSIIDYMSGSAISAPCNYGFHLTLAAAALAAEAAKIDPRIISIVGTLLSTSSVRKALLKEAAPTKEKEEIKAQLFKFYATYSAHATAVSIFGEPLSACIFLAGSDSKISKVATLAFGSLAYYVSQSSIAGALAATIASRLFQ